jgi:hypothetical protein
MRSARARRGGTPSASDARSSPFADRRLRRWIGCERVDVRRRRKGDSDLRAVPIIEVLVRHGVRYVAIGSYAAIAQGVDLAMTDLDIVPATDDENRRHLVEALEELGARERVGDQLESIAELTSQPSSVADVMFREFWTEFGKLDLVFRPAGFTRGYEDLIDRLVVVRIHDDAEPARVVDAIMAEAAAIYESKRATGRKKDADVLVKFVGIHPVDVKESARERYRSDQARRRREPPTP